MVRRRRSPNNYFSQHSRVYDQMDAFERFVKKALAEKPSDSGARKPAARAAPKKRRTATRRRRRASSR